MENKTEVMKKSTLNAKDRLDYDRLIYPMEGLLDSGYEETEEELTFQYDIEGKKPFLSILKEGMEKKYQLLINFARLWEVYQVYQISLRPENLFYDENYLVFVKIRDLYPEGIPGQEGEFLEQYQMAVAGIMGSRYPLSRLQESGIGILQGEQRFREILSAETVAGLQEILRKNLHIYREKLLREKRMVSKIGYRIWKWAAVTIAIGLLSCGGYLLYLQRNVLPRDKATLQAAQSYIAGDYTGCIDAAKGLGTEDMDTQTKYILAVAYANSESFQKEEIQTILAKLSPTSNVREMEYWIRLGRLEVEEAENLALSLSDDKLLVYAYMKELDMLERNTLMDGEEKKSRINTLEQEIKKIGEKYGAGE